VRRLVLVHGSLGNGGEAWGDQRELADSYELVVLDRPGFPPNPPVDLVDFEEHGRWVGEQLRPGDHLCGHSYGGVVSLYAAAHAGRELASLTVIEPPAFGLAAGEEVVDALVERFVELWRDGPTDPRAFASRFYAILASRQVELPDPLPADDLQSAQTLMVERGPWEADPPLDLLAQAPYPKLVVSGGWSRAFDAVCDVLEERLSAERAVLPGARHGVQHAPNFNDRLRVFLASASPR
jgi:pimeloyl-ACP methyl ester carboxylesterase